MLIPPPYVFLFYVCFFLPAKAGTLVCNSLSVISFSFHYIWTTESKNFVYFAKEKCPSIIRGHLTMSFTRYFNKKVT